MGAADNELAGGIDMQNEVIVEQCGDFGKQMLFYARQKNFFDVLFDAVKHECICVILSKPVFRLDEVVVLCRDYDGVNADRAIGFIIVFNCYLTL